MNRTIFLLIFTLASLPALAQVDGYEHIHYAQAGKGERCLLCAQYLEITDRQVEDWFDDLPSFGLYKDNYLITGIPLNEQVNKYTADIKFQLSIRQRLTKTVLPLKTFLMFTYTQKAFWDIYAASGPFTDIDFNPGLLFARPIVSDGKLKGMVSAGFEHESNGKAGLASRSWNYFVLNGAYYLNFRFSMQVKAWPGWASAENPDIYDYRGYGLVAVNYRSPAERLWLSAVVNPRGDFTSFNTQLEFNWRLGRRGSDQYLFVQYYEGYGESLLAYKHYSSMVRAGYCIKPAMRNFY